MSNLEWIKSMDETQLARFLSGFDRTYRKEIMNLYGFSYEIKIEEWLMREHK